jgi:hypothetical protein
MISEHGLRTKIEVQLTCAGGRLAARDGRIVIITSRAAIDLKGLRKEDSKERNKLEVGDHDSKRDSQKYSLGDNKDTKRGFLFLRNKMVNDWLLCAVSMACSAKRVEGLRINLKENSCPSLLLVSSSFERLERKDASHEYIRSVKRSVGVEPKT